MTCHKRRNLSFRFIGTRRRNFSILIFFSRSHVPPPTPGDRIWEQFNVGPLGFASDFGEGDIVKLDFIVVHGRGRDEGTKKQAAFSISLFLLLLSCLFNGIKVGIFASRWFRDRTF